MTNEDFIQKIESDKSWENLDNIYFSNGEELYGGYWFSDLFRPMKFNNIFYLIVRSFHSLNDLEFFFRNLFIKLMKIEVDELSCENMNEIKFQNKNLRAFLVEFNVLRPDLWDNENLSKLIYYSLVISSLMDYSTLQGNASGNTLSNVIYGIFRNPTSEFNPDRFFHRGLAELLNTLILVRRNYSKLHNNFTIDGPHFLDNDLEGITFVLQSRADLNEALTRVNNFNATEITDSILKQYDKMRRVF